MKAQILENLLKATIKDIFNKKQSNCNNKTFNFYGTTINLIQGEIKKIKDKDS